MGIGMWAFWLVLAIVVIWAITSKRKSERPGSSKTEESLEILKRRFANVEIIAKEYRDARKELES